MTNHPKTLEQALEMFDEYFYDSTHSLTERQVEHIKKNLFIPIWHAGRESVVGDCEGMKKEEHNFYPECEDSGKDCFIEGCYAEYYNLALTDVITKLSELKEKK